MHVLFLVFSIQSLHTICDTASTDLEITECARLGLIQVNCEDIGIDCDESYKGKVN